MHNKAHSKNYIFLGGSNADETSDYSLTAETSPHLIIKNLIMYMKHIKRNSALISQIKPEE